MALSEEETLACKMATELTKVYVTELHDSPRAAPTAAAFFKVMFLDILRLLKEQDV